MPCATISPMNEHPDRVDSVPGTRRVVAVLAIAAYLGAIVLSIVILRGHVVEVLGAIALVLLAAVMGWFTATRRGITRIAAAVGIVIAVTGLVAIFADHHWLWFVALLALLALATNLARWAVGADPGSLRASAPPGRAVPAATHPALIVNPKSGDGVAERTGLVEAARERGIDVTVLEPGSDLVHLARDAIARGADVIGMAGGDGSQALVAGIAAEHDLPFVCIPAGTRNHFALDLGVDREDVVGALDAFTDGFERRVDLGRVADRIFVNNVSLGIYATVVQSDEYRENKVGTVAATLPDLLGSDTQPFDLRYTNPDGGEQTEADLVLVSNNVYALEQIGGFGTRARIDGGELGVVVLNVQNASDVAQLTALQIAGRVSSFRGWHAWAAPTFLVRSGEDIAAGVDGEALTFPSPLRFEILPGALRVRVARAHPGLSPAAASALSRPGHLRLLRVALGTPANPPVRARHEPQVARVLPVTAPPSGSTDSTGAPEVARLSRQPNSTNATKNPTGTT